MLQTSNLNSTSIGRGRAARSPVWVLLATAIIVAATIIVVATGGPAAATVKGPDPTAEALTQPGPFAYQSIEVADTATPGFGAATIYHPTDQSQGAYGGIVLFPGFTSTRAALDWYAQRLASHGFVVLNANTNNPFDFPASRGNQMLAAIDYLRSDSDVASQVDGTRIGVAGHSMGGGGSLEAIADDPSIDAAVPLTPWNTDKTWDEVTTPTLIIGAENDTIASTTGHSIPFYESLPQGTERAYLELNDGLHSAPTSDNATISLYSVAWFKRYVDGDTRYTQFICPGPGVTAEISDYRSACSAGATCNGLAVTVDIGSGQLPTAGDDVILGTAAADVIEAGDGDDTICAGDGDDTVLGQAGSDTIYGGPGNDTVAGNGGPDQLFGGEGDDAIFGGSGADTIDGAAGNDTVGGAGGADTVNGGAGDDAVFGGSGPDVVVSGGFGADTVNGGAGADGNVRGGEGDDIVSGNGGDDTVRGDNGDDEVRGGPGNDEAYGGGGDDFVAGNDGIDLCDGGTGGETTGDTAASNCETILNAP